MNENEIEKKLIEHIKLQGGIITPLGKLSFTSSDRIGQMVWYILQRLMVRKLL